MLLIDNWSEEVGLPRASVGCRRCSMPTRSKRQVCPDCQSLGPWREMYSADWARDGLCAWWPQPDLWTSDHEEDQAAAKALCAGCPVQIECMVHALSVGEPGGVWGGLTPSDRGVDEPGYSR